MPRLYIMSVSSHRRVRDRTEQSVWRLLLFRLGENCTFVLHGLDVVPSTGEAVALAVEETREPAQRTAAGGVEAERVEALSARPARRRRHMSARERPVGRAGTRCWLELRR